nr:hypothetical protein Iba_chr12bCG20730 [Ipomoea batatas]
MMMGGLLLSGFTLGKWLKSGKEEESDIEVLGQYSSASDVRWAAEDRVRRPKLDGKYFVNGSRQGIGAKALEGLIAPEKPLLSVASLDISQRLAVGFMYEGLQKSGQDVNSCHLKAGKPSGSISCPNNGPFL